MIHMTSASSIAENAVEDLLSLKVRRSGKVTYLEHHHSVRGESKLASNGGPQHERL